MKLAILIVYALVLLVIGIVSALRIKSPLDYLLAGKRNGALQFRGACWPPFWVVRQYWEP
jgi:SSS family solute:Na+ symporter